MSVSVSDVHVLPSDATDTIVNNCCLKRSVMSLGRGRMAAAQESQVESAGGVAQGHAEEWGEKSARRRRSARVMLPLRFTSITSAPTLAQR